MLWGRRNQADGGHKHVFIEANPFASRLHVLTPILRGACAAAANVLVVHPDRHCDEHWFEWRDALPQCVALDGVSARCPMAKPGKSGPLRLGRLLLKALSCSSRGDSISLTALDDYLLSSIVCLPILASFRLTGRRVVVYKYRVDDVLASKHSLRPLLIKLATRLVLDVTNGALVIFDERFAHIDGVVVFPDPWSGSFGAVEPQHAKPLLGLDPNRPVVGLIGRQDHRKGFPLAATCLKALRRSGWNGQVLILGEVVERYRDDLKSLSDCFGGSLVQQTTFVPDKELPAYFAACDVIWLPYHARFTASSGVLARAAASGVPVVASAGGLIAHRVLTHSLGQVISGRDFTELSQATLSLLESRGGFDEASARRWADGCHENATEALARHFYVGICAG